MKHYIFNGKLIQENVDALLKELTSNDDKYLIYIDTAGGLNTIKDYLLYYLNLTPERFTLIAGNEITSNGFWLFYHFKGKRIISDSTISMIHQSWKEVPSYDLKDKESTGYKDLQKLQNINDKNLEILKPYFSKKEIKDFKRGYDVYLNSDRLKQIFNIEK